MPRVVTIRVVVAVTGFLAAGASAYYLAKHSATNVPRAPDERLIYLDIFLNLELADSPELFHSDANIERYGLIPSPPDPKGNPDGLPIGVTKQEMKEGRWKGVDAGINCADCHNSELHYQGQRIRIDGDVASHFDTQALFHCVNDIGRFAQKRTFGTAKLQSAAIPSSALS